MPSEDAPPQEHSRAIGRKPLLRNNIDGAKEQVFWSLFGGHQIEQAPARLERHEKIKVSSRAIGSSASGNCAARAQNRTRPSSNAHPNSEVSFETDPCPFARRRDHKKGLEAILPTSERVSCPELLVGDSGLVLLVNPNLGPVVRHIAEEICRN